MYGSWPYLLFHMEGSRKVYDTKLLESLWRSLRPFCQLYRIPRSVQNETSAAVHVNLLLEPAMQKTLATVPISVFW